MAQSTLLQSIIAVADLAKQSGVTSILIYVSPGDLWRIPVEEIPEDIGLAADVRVPTGQILVTTKETGIPEGYPS